MSKLFLGLSAVPVLVLASWLPLHATSVERMSLRDMAARSSDIVHGTVVSTASRWNEDRSLIVTDIQIQVIESLKGDGAGMVTVTQPGGEVGKIRVDVPGALAFRPGEEAVLFLGRGNSGTYRVAGLSLGRFQVVENEKTGEKRVRDMSPHRSLSPASPGRGAISGPRSASLAGFLGEVRDLVSRPRR